ncbi:hypothetical protein HBB16_06610 [Pseudonocardia sp. MCCB 268]|nr:hypothetical protein [Pseudonocardia cytotoxica]
MILIARSVPQPTEHGTFVTHAYPYPAGGAPSDRDRRADAAPRRVRRHHGGHPAREASDEVSLRYLEQVFGSCRTSAHRQPDPLAALPRSAATAGPDGRVKLLGDAAHTAHFSIGGSGTKLAMEDAIELVAAPGRGTGPGGGVRAAEAVRRPAVERPAGAGPARSQPWWGVVPSRTHLPVDRLMVAYMSRAGNVP